MKNPTILKKFERNFLQKQKYENQDFYFVNTTKHFLMNYNNNWAFSNEIIILQKDQFHEIEIMNKFNFVKLYVKAEAEILLNSDTKQKVEQDQNIILVNLKEQKIFTMKSNKEIRILKIIVSDEL